MKVRLTAFNKLYSEVMGWWPEETPPIIRLPVIMGFTRDWDGKKEDLFNSEPNKIAKFEWTGKFDNNGARLYELIGIE